MIYNCGWMVLAFVLGLGLGMWVMRRFDQEEMNSHFLKNLAMADDAYHRGRQDEKEAKS